MSFDSVGTQIIEGNVTHPPEREEAKSSMM